MKPIDETEGTRWKHLAACEEVERLYEVVIGRTEDNSELQVNMEKFIWEREHSIMAKSADELIDALHGRRSRVRSTPLQKYMQTQNKVRPIFLTGGILLCTLVPYFIKVHQLVTTTDNAAS